MGLITTHEAAARLARTIISDIALYNKDKVTKGIQNDNLFDLLADAIKEGENLYHQRVDPALVASTNFYNKALVDVLVKRNADIKSEIW